MEYLTKEELRKNTEIRKKLVNFSGPTTKTGFSLDVLKKYQNILFKGRKDIKILDAGTASGSFAKDVHGLGIDNIYGVDIDNYLAEDNKKYFKDFKIADLSTDKVPFQDNYFDIVTAWCVLPHLENPFHFMREIHKILRPGGIFVFSLININSPSHRKYFYRHGDFPGYHENNNHITLLTKSVFNKTFLKYFDFIGEEYFINPRIFGGLRGVIRKFVYGLAGESKIKNKLNERWGPKVVYILKKK